MKIKLKNILTRKFLIDKYIKNNISVTQIALEINCGKTIVYTYLKKFNIPITKKHQPNCQCVACKSKRGETKGTYGSNYVDGRSIKSYYCKYCGKPIDWLTWVYGKRQCRKCYAINRKNKKLNHKKNCQCASCKAKRGEYKGKNNPQYIDGRKKKKHYCIEPGCHNEISYETWSNGTKRCKSCAIKNNWKNDDFRNKTLRNSLLASISKPNKPEKLLYSLLTKLFPKEYKINVKGEVMILGGKIPDFVNVNGQKKVIELFGDYWHSDKFIKNNGKDNVATENGRIDYFKKLGYKTLIVWENELKNIDKLKNRLVKFNGVKNE